MSTVVCQTGLQSETLLFKLDPRERCENEEGKAADPDSISPNSGHGGFSFIDLLSDISLKPREAITDAERRYLPPQVKKRFPLNERSLTLCTEQVGSENGSELHESSALDFWSFYSDSENRITTVRKKKTEVARTCRTSDDFPPLLSTLTSRYSIEISSGRFLMRAIESAPKRDGRIHVERSNGRLRMCLMGGEAEENGENSEEEEEEGEGKNVEDTGGRGNMVIGEFQRPSRCSEGGKGTQEGGLLNNMESFWVATS